jgi:hypothetical protein
MPFRYDDDASFGPHFDRIISNQEEQHLSDGLRS